MRKWIIRGAWISMMVVFACGGGSANDPGTYNPTTAGNRGGAAQGAGTGGNAVGSQTGQGEDAHRPGTPGNPVTVVTPVDPASSSSVCSNSIYMNAKELDLFIMEDRSWSMNENVASGQAKWTMITDAITAFLSDPKSSGIGVGIGYFAQFVGAVPQGAGDYSANSCDVNQYATPSVPIGLLPDTEAAIVASIKATSPAGWTPTVVAEQGALQYARQYAQAHPDHRVIVVLATDGLPTACPNSLNDQKALVPSVVAAAQEGLNGNPSIKTYMIGVFGPQDPDYAASSLNEMATGGGTGAAFIVNTSSTAAAQQFITAMTSIREANQVGCTLRIPTNSRGGVVDLSQATVMFEPSGGPSSSLTWRSEPSGCAGAEGYSYDNNNAPTVIQLCPATCDRLLADSAAKVAIYMGCYSGSTPGGDAGHGGEPNGGDCLLTGQYCNDGTECCSGICTDHACAGPPIN